MQKFYFKQLLAAALLLCSIVVSAHDFVANNIYYNITSETNATVEVTFAGSNYSNYTSEYIDDVVIPSTVEYNGTAYTVTAITNDAFRDCKGIISIVIPSTVKSIGTYAFSGCISLESATVPNNVANIGEYAFNGCHLLNSFTIPAKTTTIERGVFKDCQKLTTVNIHNKVTSIGDEAFRNCRSLEGIELPNSITSITKYAFTGCSSLKSITIPNSVSAIRDSSFENCTSLESVSIPNSVTGINGYAFHNCKSLKNIVIPNSVSHIGNYAFDNCASLESVTLPQSITYISNHLIENCSSLKSITIPDNVTTIYSYAFRNCTNLENVIIPNSVIEIQPEAFQGCTSLKNINLPNSVREIGYHAFTDCKSLENIVIPSSLNYITNNTFEGCTNLKNVTLPNSITEIRINAFHNCTSLESVVIPNSVTKIGESAFKGCTNLKEAILSSNLTSIEAYAFEECTSLQEVSMAKGSIGEKAFYGCTSLSKVLLGDLVTSVGNNAFENCAELRTIDLGNGITYIGDKAFYNTKWWNSQADGVLYLDYWLIGIKNTKPTNNYTIPAGTVGIAANALSYSYEMTGINIPDGLKYINADAFKGCSGIKFLKLPSSIVSYDQYAFRDCGGIKEAYIDCPTVTDLRALSGIRDVFFGENVKTIKNDAFYNCKNLGSITISKNVATIESYAFSYCSGLASVLSYAKYINLYGSPFYGISSEATLTYPAGYDYSAWKGYFSNVVADNLLYLQIMLEDTQALLDTSIEGAHYGSYLPGTKQELQALVDELNSKLENESTDDEQAKSYVEQLKAGIDKFNSQIVSTYLNTLHITNTKALTKTETTLSVNMSNETEISSIQFDIYLPKGMTFTTDNSGNALVEMTTERTTEEKHTFEHAIQADGALRVICYSNSNDVFSGNKGEVFKVTVSAGEEMLDKTYDIEIKNITLSEANGIRKYDVPLSTSTIDVRTYITGDANGDRNIDVSDVTELVNYILTGSQENFNMNGGDANEDGIIDVADITTIISMILGTYEAPAPQAARAAATRADSDEISSGTSYISTSSEGETMLINVTNPVYEFSAIQFDLYLPEGIEITNDGEFYDIFLGSRTSSRKHSEPATAIQPDGAMRVVIYSNTNKLFSGTEGDVATINIKANGLEDGTYDFVIKNVILSAPGSKEVLADYAGTINVKNGTTGLTNIAAESTDGNIYDLSGRKVTGTVKGQMYIKNGRIFVE